MDDFIHISTSPPPPPSSNPRSDVSHDYFRRTQGERWFTEGQMVSSIRQTHPMHVLTVNSARSCDLLAFADSRGDTSYTSFQGSAGGGPLVERQFVPPPRRYNDEGGRFAEKVVFGAFEYVFREDSFLVYVVEGHDGMMSKTRLNYILASPGSGFPQEKTDRLVEEATRWMQELHGEVLVFDQGFWQKNRELWQNIQKAKWEDVILEEGKKKSIIDDVLGFFDSEGRYSEFGVPWKRGIIFYGPPGNGKTISTKALMHDISTRTHPTLSSLYVKTFASYGGPEASIRNIFTKARQMAPCLLIFEDIDSLVTPAVRSYFLNEVDGLESNHGILMIGSTNHLERLDPGIARRPSRFDRKYVFENPDEGEREAYSEYWRKKLRGNGDVVFPERMSARVAGLTGGFSFAYMKEAFVAALLVIVARSGDDKDDKSNGDDDYERSYSRGNERGGGGDGEGDDLDGNVLWKELKKQISALRKEMEDEGEEAGRSSTGMMKSEFWPAMSGILDNRTPPQTQTQPMDIRSAMPRYM